MKIQTSANLNILWAHLIVEELIRQGVDHFHIAPGSRSAPLTIAVAENPRAKTFIHYDERGLGFHALGYTSATGRPAAVITTSGTAVANLLPSVVETFKKKLPMIILTADRPPELRYTGANQTIDQVGIFGKYVRFQFDLPCPTMEIAPEAILTTVDQLVHQSKSNPSGPVHLNCMFREPLAPIAQKFPKGVYLKNLNRWMSSKEPYTRYVNPQTQMDTTQLVDPIKTLQKIKNGIIVVGKIKMGEERDILQLAERLQWPIFPDITSSLRLGNSSPLAIAHFAHLLNHPQFLKGPKVDGVLHLGGRITSRRWYDWVEKYRPQHHLTVLHHPLRNDPSHLVDLRIQSPVGEFCRAVAGQIQQRREQELLRRCQKLSKTVSQRLDKFFSIHPSLSEPQLMHSLSGLLPKNSGLFLASSLPIREMDLFARADGNPVLIGSNRGASGIDGNLATAVGFQKGLNRPMTLLIGDLACLHDLNSLSLAAAADQPLVIIVINNDGGGIFSFLPIGQFPKIFETYFATPHGLRFQKFAEGFDCRYVRPTSLQDFRSEYQKAILQKGCTVMEVKTNRAENYQLQKKLQNFIHART